MKKRWNMMGKMAVCSFAAVMVMAGTRCGITARAEMIMNNEDELQTVTEMVPEENMEALPEEAPAAQETGETDLEVMQVVVIEEEQVPGAAAPEMTGEEAADAQEEDAGEPAEGEQGEDVPENPVSGEAAAGDTPEEQQAVPEEKSETCVSGMITYEDSEVSVTVVASEAAQLPADTTVKVTRLAEGSAEYEAAKEAARQSVGAGESASYTFYDVTLESKGQALDVEEGTVSVKMEFRTDAAQKEVVSIEETEGGKVARNVTDRTAERAGSVALSY